MIEEIFKLYKRPLVLDTIRTTIWSTIGKAVGFIVPFFIAAWFGASDETDAFFFAYGLILFLSGIFAPVVESVIVPYIAEARTKNEDVGRFVGSILSISGVGLFVLAGLFILFIKPILSVITRFDEQTSGLIYQLLVEAAPLIILLVWTSVLAGVLNTYKKFVFPAVSPAFRAVVNLIVIFAFKNVYGVHSIALGYVIGELVRLAILFIIIKKLNLFKLRLSLRFGHRLWEFFGTASYQIAGMAAIGLNPFVDKTMASWLGGGSVSVLYYADRLYMIPTNFLTTGLMVTLLSHWSGWYYQSGGQQLRNDVIKTIKAVTFITLPVMLLLIVFHQPIVKLAFGRGVFSQERLSEVGWVWVCYLVGFVPYMLDQVIVRAYLTLKNTKALMWWALSMNLSNILLNYILMRPFKVAGIALATSIVYLTSFFFLTATFEKEVAHAGG
jgi:putative peptidoglycan lipid II flippase